MFKIEDKPAMTQQKNLEKKVQTEGKCPACDQKHVHRENCSRAEKLLPKYEFVEGKGHIQTGWTR